ncbi:hypothetical protein ADEAN_000980800 [Angomonas deanei]|uniref:CFAP74 fourth Ig-like domain-containing protein n=1 Tax=Angomonas deanei TaxID=59799 RepID=A0A7G2CR31_9TRYP|nr:hypothetical protein ADEAN_000980800 [Angomonas deanei]
MTYKNEVTIYNNSNVSANVDPKVPADLREVLAFDPPSACIQPKSSYSFSVIFTPVDEIVDENFSIKANFKVKGQALPASLLIKAQLTHRQPEVSKNYFDLGEIFVNQEQAFSVSVKNSSKLIQTIGILDLPQNIKVSPDVLQFLPEEEVTLNFGIVPPCLGKFSQEIVVINEYGDKSPIIIDGVGKRPKLFFSDSQIALPPCAVGSSISASTVVTNTTGRAIQFQFKSSEKLISISPSFGTIAPGSTLPIFFELSTVFVPKSTEDTGKPAEQPRKKSQQRVRSKSQLSEAPQEPVTDFSSWKPISPTAKVKTASITCFDRENTDDAFLIDINCIVVEPVLVAACLIESAQASVAVKPNNVKASKKNKEISLPVDAVTVTPYSSKTKIDCGEISIFHSLERHVLIRNNSANPVQLRMLPMNPVSPFSIVRFPCSPLPPFSEDCCLLQFKPRDYGEYQESVVIYSEDTNRVELDLKGMCCFTNIIISEHESQAADFSDIETIGSFWFDTTIRGENSSKTLYLYNLGSFSLQVSLELSDADKEKHGVFLFHPSKFDVAAKSFTTVQLVFAPQEEGLTEADLKIKAGGFEEKMRLIGRSSATSVYTIIPLVDRHEEKINPSQMGLSHEYPLLFKFTKGETKRFMVGSVKNGPSVECFVEKWNDYYEAIGWKVDIFRFSVPGGTESRLSISLKSEQEQTKDVFIPFCRFTLNIKCSSDSQNDRVYYISCVGS